MTQMTMQGLQDLLLFPFRDSRWKEKFLTGSILAFLSIILAPTIILSFVPGIFLYGYFARAMRLAIVERTSAFLPEWDEWGDLARDGLKLAVVVFVYMLPVLVLFVLAYGFMFAMPFLGELMGDNEAQVITEIVSVIGMLGFMPLFAISMLGMLCLSVLLPAVIGHMLAKDHIGAAFRFGEWWAVFRANWGGFLLAYVLIMGVWMVLSFLVNFLYLTIIFCCLIPFVLSPISVYLIPVSAVLFGEAYRFGADRVASSLGASPAGEEVEPWEAEPGDVESADPAPGPKETIALSGENESEHE
ncbi:MAG: DUF4013 domain-containing protein [Anaerolineales bacterium]|nr:DUF4013 domain-containing protein [Anaerolineales bacterium]